MMAEAIYLLCALTSITRAALLWRSWRRTHARLLIWSTVCFVALAVNNCLLFVDLVLVRDSSLVVLRNAAALIGVGSLLAGLIWETAS
jgi:Family of unknown function (DUF5985)